MNNDISPEDQGAFIMDSEDPVAKWKDWHIRLLRKDVGPRVDKMVQDRRDAERQLADPDWKVRCAALSILELHWDAAKDPDFAQKCEDIAFGDAEPEVRACALRVLGVCYENTNNLRVGKLLAQAVLDARQPSASRGGAYLGLFHLRGLRLEWPGNLTVPPTPHRIPDDVDWQFVRSFLGSGSMPGMISP
jgi:hypothetical protein